MFRVVNIEWNTDDVVIDDLPVTIDIPDDVAIDEDGEVDTESIGDYISDLTSFCHFGYDIEEVS